MNVSEWMSGFDQVLRCPCEFLTCLSGNSPRCTQKPVYPIMRMSNHPYYIGICTVTFCFRPCVRPMTPACSPLFPTSHGWPVCRVAPTAPRQPAPRTPPKSLIFLVVGGLHAAGPRVFPSGSPILPSMFLCSASALPVFRLMPARSPPHALPLHCCQAHENQVGVSVSPL